MIGLDIGLWSGFKRKMEIAESFAQPIVIVSTVNINVLTFLEVVLTMNRCYAEQAHLLQLQTYPQQILGLKRLALHTQVTSKLDLISEQARPSSIHP